VTTHIYLFDIRNTFCTSDNTYIFVWYTEHILYEWQHIYICLIYGTHSLLVTTHIYLFDTIYTYIFVWYTKRILYEWHGPIDRLWRLGWLKNSAQFLLELRTDLFERYAGTALLSTWRSQAQSHDVTNISIYMENQILRMSVSRLCSDVHEMRF